MAKYELTPTQKKALRREGHVNIIRNSRKVRVTPSMLKVRKSIPPKRHPRPKKKAVNVDYISRRYGPDLHILRCICPECGTEFPNDEFLEDNGRFYCPACDQELLM